MQKEIMLSEYKKMSFGAIPTYPGIAFNMYINLATRGESAGFEISITLLSTVCLFFEIKDTRQWDYENNCFEDEY